MHYILEFQFMLCGCGDNKSRVERRVVEKHRAITYMLQKSSQRHRKRLTTGIYIGLCDTCDLRYLSTNGVLRQGNCIKFP